MIPVRLELTNFQAYDQASLDFSFSSALIIGERDNDTNNSNAVGKSSLLDSIAWALFGKSKHKNADSVVKRGCEVCEVKFTFVYGNTTYRVERKRNSRFSRTDVSFYHMIGETEVLQQGDTNKDIDLKIRETIHSNYDVFLSSCYFRQNSVNDFMSSTPSDKQRLLGSMLNLERWNKKSDSAKVRLNHILKDMDNLAFKLKGMETLESDLAATQTQFENSKSELSLTESTHTNVVNQIRVLESRVNDMRMAESKLIDYHDTMSQMENVESRLTEMETSLKAKTFAKTELLDQSSKNATAIEQLNAKITDISNHLSLKDKVDLPALEAMAVKGKVKYASISKEVEEWNPDKICECCGKTNSAHADKLEKHQSLSQEQEAVRIKLDALLQKIESARTVLEKIRDSELEIEKYTQKIRSLNQTAELNSLKIQALEKEIEMLSSSVKEKTEQKSVLESKIASLKGLNDALSYEELRNSLNKAKQHEGALIEKRNTLMYETGILSQKVVGLNASIADKTATLAQVEVLKHEAAIFLSVVKSFGRTGIQAVIIDNVIDEWTKTANGWLSKFCYEPTHIKITTQKSDGKGGWKETFEIEVHTPSGISDFDSLSGGEAFKVAFAMRVSLAQVQARRMGGHAQLLLLDEVSTALDRQGRETFVSLIRLLEREMKILVITHDDHLKEEFDHIITVKRVGSDSTLTI